MKHNSGSARTEWGALHYQATENGIEFSIDGAFDKAGLKEEADRKGYRHAEHGLFEHLTSNGWDWIQPEEVGALTDAPIISDNAVRNDRGELESVDYVYWYPDYQIRSIVDDLINYGKSFFHRAEGR